MESDVTGSEIQLIRIFQNASKRKALLLLDEVKFLWQRRGGLHLERNRLVGVFLRRLEYCGGILFLTTNRIERLDEAILDTVHLKLN